MGSNKHAFFKKSARTRPWESQRRKERIQNYCKVVCFQRIDRVHGLMGLQLSRCEFRQIHKIVIALINNAKCERNLSLLGPIENFI